MKFSEFAKILEEFYKGEMNKGNYVKTLFCNITDNEDEIDRSNITFAKYMDGNSIKPIAIEIKYYLNTEKFKKYLAQREKNTDAKEKMRQAFEKSAPDIDTKNLFEKITGIFVDIINNACNKPDGRCKERSVNDEVIPAIAPVESNDGCNKQPVDDEVIPVIDTVKSDEKWNRVWSASISSISLQVQPYSSRSSTSELSTP